MLNSAIFCFGVHQLLDFKFKVSANQKTELIWRPSYASNLKHQTLTKEWIRLKKHRNMENVIY